MAAIDDGNLWPTTVPPYPLTTVFEFQPTVTLYGIQNAANTFQYNSGLSLLEDGCPDEGRCAVDCADIDHIFSSPATFQNCLAYTTISQLIANETATPSDLALAHKYAIDGTLTDIAKSVGDCLQGFISVCQLDPACKSRLGGDTSANLCQPLLSAEPNATFDLTGPSANHGALFGCVEQLCPSIDQSVNIDVGGGVGVYVSYYMQSIIILIIFGMFVFWSFLLYYVQRARKPRPPRTKQAGLTGLIERLEPNRHLDALISGTIEFQKAQCFFMCAIQIASIIVIKAGTLGATNLTQLIRTFYFIVALSFGGSIPPTFVLFQLHALKKKSWELWIITAVTVILSTAAFFYSTKLDLKANEVNLATATTTSFYPGCGSINPMAYCYQFREEWFEDTYLPSFRQKAAIVFSIIILIILLIDLCDIPKRSAVARYWLPVKTKADMLDTTIRNLPGLRRAIRFYYHTSATSDGPNNDKNEPELRRQPNILWVVVSSLASVFIVIWYIINFILFFTKLYLLNRVNASGGIWAYISDAMTGGVEWSDWSFGQIIAVTVLLPPIFSYLTFELRGMEKGHQARLPDSWKVVAMAPFRALDGATSGNYGIPLHEQTAHNTATDPRGAYAAVGDEEHNLNNMSPNAQQHRGTVQQRGE